MRGNRLAEIREIYEVSQREVAELLGIGKSAYARWETLERYIPLNRLNDFCNLYKVSMDYAMNLSSVNCSTIKKLSIDKKLVGKRLKKIRESFNITQEQLATQLNTSHSTISAYENGKTMILTIFALDICKKYKISLDWLCGKSNVIILKNNI